jgi:anti-repressor protein
VKPLNELQVFEYQENQIRTVVDEQGNPWWVAKDVCTGLGYSRFDSNLLGNVPEEWKGTKPIRTPGGEQDMLCLSEQGLYFFLARSDKPSAFPFQKWIAGDVIPSIRKHGMYATPQTVEQLIADPDTIITILQEIKKGYETEGRFLRCGYWLKARH